MPDLPAVGVAAENKVRLSLQEVMGEGRRVGHEQVEALPVDLRQEPVQGAS